MIRPGIRLGLTLVTAVVVGCVDPEGQRPGLRLSGESAREFPADWSFKWVITYAAAMIR